MKNKRKTVFVTLSIISMVIINVCTILPIFSFWNYRLCMIPFALISILLLFVNFNKNTKKNRVIISCIIMVLSGIGLWLGLGMIGGVLRALLSGYIAFLLLLPHKNRRVVLTLVPAMIAIIWQTINICIWYRNYNLSNSGLFLINSDVADRMFAIVFNEIGMTIVICCLICIAFSIEYNLINNDENQYKSINESSVNKVSVNLYEFKSESLEQKEGTLFCPKCGIVLISGSIFCNKCGTKIEINNSDDNYIYYDDNGNVSDVPTSHKVRK